MRELLRTNDPVLLSLAEAVLGEAGIGCFVADRNISIVEGSLGIFPRRVLVVDDDGPSARDELIAAGVAAGDLTPGAAGELAAAPSPRTDDAFLGGRLRLLQPKRAIAPGSTPCCWRHRSRPRAGQSAGCGRRERASSAWRWRRGSADSGDRRRDRAGAGGLANENARRNGLADRVRVV